MNLGFCPCICLRVAVVTEKYEPGGWNERWSCLVLLEMTGERLEGKWERRNSPPPFLTSIPSLPGECLGEKFTVSPGRLCQKASSTYSCSFPVSCCSKSPSNHLDPEGPAQHKRKGKALDMR